MVNQIKKTRQIPRISQKVPLTIGQFLSRYSVALLVFLISLLVTFPYDRGERLERYPQSGEVSKETVIAPFTFEIMKTNVEFEAESLAVVQRVLPIFVYDSSAIPRMLSKTDSLSATFFLLRRQGKESGDSLTRKLRVSVDSLLTPKDAQIFLEYPDLLTSFSNYLKEISRKGILSCVVVSSPQELEQFQQEYNSRYPSLTAYSRFIELDDGTRSVSMALDSLHTIPEIQRQIARDLSLNRQAQREISSAVFRLTNVILEPTLIYNNIVTQQRKIDAATGISRIKATVLKDVEIVRKHQIVTPEIAGTLEILRKERFEHIRVAWHLQIIVSTIVVILLIIAVMGLIIFYIRDYVPFSISRQTFFTAMSLILAGQFAIIRGSELALEHFFEYSGYFDGGDIFLIYGIIPMAAAPLIASILFNRQCGLYVSLFFSVYVGIITEFNLVASIGTLITGGTAAYLAKNVRYRKHYFQLIFWMIAVNTTTDLLVSVAGREIALVEVTTTIFFSISDAIFSVLIVLMLIPLFEHIFNITTDMTLMELSDMNNPLLKRLSIEAPGTYNHSVLVANLAESAAAQIGANALLCRVAAYYHDVGKIIAPGYFIENQIFEENPHDRITPAASAKIIANHVTDSLELARQYRLPKILHDAMVEHHGDSPIVYFYHKANEKKKAGEVISLQEYSYSGLKPQNKENAILMIADTVEAISRTMKGTRGAEMREMVQKVVRDKINSGQLDECGLTFREVHEIVEGFMPILRGIFHSRIEYPEEEILDNEVRS